MFEKIYTLARKHFLKILILILLLAISARLFAIFSLPASAYNDEIYHLLLSKKVIEQQTIFLQNEAMPLPYFYILNSVLFILSGFPMALPFVRIIPFVFTFLLILVVFFVSKELFQKKQAILIATSFTAIHSMIARYSSVNYTDSIGAFFLLLALLFFIRFYKTSSEKYLALTAFSMAVLAIAKLNATVALVAIFPAFAYVVFKKVSFKKALVFVVMAFLLSSMWFTITFLKSGTFSREASSELANISSGGFLARNFLGNVPLFFVKVYDFPPLSELQKIPFANLFSAEILVLTFAILTLPMTAMVLFSFFKMIKSKKLINLTIIFSVMAVFLVILFISFEARLFIPAIPLIGIIFAKQFSETSSKKIKAIAFASFLIFSIFSFSYVIGTTVFFRNVYLKHEAVLDVIKALPENSYIYSSNFARAIEFYSGKKAFWTGIENFNNSNEIYEGLKQGNYTHFLFSCHESPFSEKVLSDLEEEGKLILLYQDCCAKLFEIK